MTITADHRTSFVALGSLVIIVGGVSLCAVPVLAQEGAALTPLKAVFRDTLPFQSVMDPGLRIVPKDRSAGLLVVFLRGLGKSGASVRDLAWRIRQAKGDPIDPIGFGVLQSTDSVVFFGQLTSGRLLPDTNSSDPLLPLIFVVARDVKEVRLLAPSGAEQTLSVDSDWTPGAEQLLAKVRADGFGIMQPRRDGKTWRMIR